MAELMDPNQQITTVHFSFGQFGNLPTNSAFRSSIWKNWILNFSASLNRIKNLKLHEVFNLILFA